MKLIRAIRGFLVKKRALERKALQDRFEIEPRPYLLEEERDSTTLEIWLEELFSGDRR